MPLTVQPVLGSNTHLGQGRLVLVVDDEDDIRLLCQRALEYAGFRVITAADAPEAMHLFQDRKDEVVLIILDMTIPTGDGYELGRQFKMQRPDVKIIMTSGLDCEGRSPEPNPAYSVFLPKPYRLQELVNTAKVLLGPSSPQGP